MDSNTDLPQQPANPQQPPSSFQSHIRKIIFIVLLIVNVLFVCWAFWLMYSVSLRNITAGGMAIFAVIGYFLPLAAIDLVAVLYYLRPHGTPRVIISAALVLVSLPLIYYLISIIFQRIYLQMIFQSNSLRDPASTLISPRVSFPQLQISPQLSPTTFIPASFYLVPSTNPILTSNWKTYKNEKYSFSFRYPPRMYANTPPYPETMKDRFSDDIVLQTKQILPDDAKNKNEQELNVLYEGVVGGDLLFTFSDKDFFHDSETLEILKRTSVNYKDEGIIIGGKTGRIISGNDFVLAQNKPHIRHIDIPLQQDKYLNIEYYENAITLEEFDQILSTLKFTDH
jgi:hypothetical protein